jgi:hypothetical protein
VNLLKKQNEEAKHEKNLLESQLKKMEEMKKQDENKLMKEQETRMNKIR